MNRPARRHVHKRQVRMSRRPIARNGLPADDPTQRCPDISFAREKLNWEPKVPLKQGLERTIAYFDALLKQGTHAALKSLNKN